MKKRKAIHWFLAAVLMISVFPIGDNGMRIPAEASASNEQTIYAYLKDTFGFNTAAACGILGNISVESNFSPTAYNVGEDAWGICQWQDSRLTNLQNRYPSTWKTLDAQLGFLKWELEGGDYAGKGTVNYLKSVSNTAEGASAAAKYFAQNFERCDPVSYSTRMYGAQYMYWPKYSDSIPIDARYPTPFTAYPLAMDDGTVVAYDGIGGSSIGHIYANDECQILIVYESGWCLVHAPWTGYSDGRDVYTKLSYFLDTSLTPYSIEVASQTTTYKKSDRAETFGYIGAGDSVVVVGKSGTLAQVIYPLIVGGYKCGWAEVGCAHQYETGYEAVHPHRYYKKCVFCGDWYYTGEYAATYTTSTTPATCTAAGSTTKTCKICGAVESTSTPALGHSWGGWTPLNAAQHQRVCARDASHKETASHTWDGGRTSSMPTCTGAGVKIYTCTGCSATKTEQIDPIGHYWGDWTRLNDTYHRRVCGNDPSHEEQETHAWDNGVVTKEPTATESGVKTFTCAVCKATKTEELPIDAPDFEHGDINGDGTVNNKDLTRLMKYLAGEDVSVVENTLDVNGDGTVNNKDLTRLMKYLAGDNF